MSLNVRRPEPRLSRSMIPLVAVFFGAGISAALIGPMLSLFLSTEVAATTGQVTLFLVLTPLAGVLTSTALGRLSDRRPIRRTIMALAGVAGTAGCAAAAHERRFWVLLALSVTVLAVPTSLFPQVFAYARQVLERDAPNRVALAMSALRTVFSLAWVAGPAMAAFALEIGGFALVFSGAAAVYALATVVIVSWLPPEPPHRTPRADHRERVPAPLRRRLLIAGVAFTLLSTPLTVSVQTIPLFVGSDLGGSIRDAGFVLGLCALLEIPLMLGLGALAGRVPLQILLYAGAACGVCYFVLAAASSSVGVLLAGQVLNAVFISGSSALGMTFVQNMLPGLPGRASTLFANTFPVGAILAGPIVGLGQAHGYRLGYVICAALCVGGLLTLVSLRARVRDRLP